MCACGKEDSEAHMENIEEISSIEDIKSAEKEAAEQWAKGYDLPMDEREEKESENDCSTMMELIWGIYEHAYKGEASNVVLNDETVLEIIGSGKCGVQDQHLSRLSLLLDWSQEQSIQRRITEM